MRMPAALINVHEAKTQLSRLIERALAGEEIIIAKAGKPLIRLMPVLQDSLAVRRSLGALRDEIEMSADFAAPLDADALADFEGALPRPRGKARGR